MDIILCGSRREGAAFMRERGLTYRQVRIVAQADQLAGAGRVKRVYSLPGFETNPHRFSIRAQMRWLRPQPEFVPLEPTEAETAESEGTRDALAILAEDVDPVQAATVAADLTRATV